MLEAQTSNPDAIENVMSAAEERNITVMRIFAVGLDPQLALQEAPGRSPQCDGWRIDRRRCDLSDHRNPTLCGCMRRPTRSSLCLVFIGKYNETVLQALDGVMAAAARHGVRVTLVLARNWENPDSKALVS